jgi:hypothetical protein
MWSNYLTPYIFSITFLVFVIPLILLCVRKSIFKLFTFHKLTTIFNWTLIYYVAISAVFLITMKIIDVKVYGQERNNDFTDVIMGVCYTYVVIGFFFYLPSVAILNIINLTIKKIKEIKKEGLFRPPIRDR